MGPGRVAGLLGRELFPGILPGKLGFAEGMLGRDVGSLGFETFAPPPDGSFGEGMEGRACGEGRLTLGRLCGAPRPPPPPPPRAPPLPRLPRCCA